MRFLFFIVFLISEAISSNSYTQPENGKLIGRILDNQSESGHNKVTVTLFEDDLPKFSTRTNSLGNFSFMSIPAGEYRIKVKKSGFDGFEKIIRINPNFTLKMIVKIKSKAQSQKETASDGLSSVSTSKKSKAEIHSSDLNLDPIEPVIEIQTEKGDSLTDELKDSERPVFVDFPDEIPSPEGGLVSIIKNIEYPEIARRMGIEGISVVTVTVNQNGVADEIKIIKSAGPVLDEAAIKTIYKTKFIAGKYKGKEVISTVTIPVKFQIK